MGRGYVTCVGCLFPTGHDGLCCECADCRRGRPDEPGRLLPTLPGGPAFGNDDDFAVRKVGEAWGAPPLACILSGRGGWMVLVSGDAAGVYAFAPKAPHVPEGVFEDRAAAAGLAGHLSDRIASTPDCGLSVHLVRITKEEL